jgi:hypothetical protein
MDLSDVFALKIGGTDGMGREEDAFIFERARKA